MNALGLIHALSADPASSNSTLRFEFALLFEFHVAGEFEGAPAGMFADVASTGVLVLERMPGCPERRHHDRGEVMTTVFAAGVAAWDFEVGCGPLDHVVLDTLRVSDRAIVGVFG